MAILSGVSATELFDQIKALPPRERRKFFAHVHELEQQLATKALPNRRKPIQWPDAAGRRRRIFGDKVLPNLVLLAREAERY